VEKDLCATILVDGSLKCGSQIGSIHGLAKLLLHAPVNGWDCWFFEDASGIRQPIDNLRKELRLLKGEKDE
jgi:hypothetical protein